MDCFTSFPTREQCVLGPLQERGETYTHGHHESVLRIHRWRTADNSAAYLLDKLRPGDDVLDVGCGPGTVTVGLADRVTPGRVVGVDNTWQVLAEARALTARSAATDLSFVVGDAYRLAFADESFDVVHAHQLLQHLTDPVAGLSEMRRVPARRAHRRPRHRLRGNNLASG